MPAAEIENLNSLRNLLADLPVWVTWTGLGTTELRLARVAACELEDAASLPAICIDFGAGRRINAGANDSSANYRPSGTFGVSVYAFDDEAGGDDLTTRFLNFAGNFFQLIDEIVSVQEEIIVGSIQYSDQPITRDAVNVFQAEDANDDSVDDSDPKPVWVGSFILSWGGPPNS